MTNAVESAQEAEAIHATLHRLEQRWNVVPIPDNRVWHAWDPLPFWDFFRGVRRAAELTDRRRFLDLGCGIGTKLAIMDGLGWQVSGIDHHEPYVEAARELVPEAEIRLSNILDCEQLDADLVYMYRPAREENLEVAVEQHVLSVVAPGSVMFWPLRHSPEVWLV